MVLTMIISSVSPINGKSTEVTEEIDEDVLSLDAASDTLDYEIVDEDDIYEDSYEDVVPEESLGEVETYKEENLITANEEEPEDLEDGILIAASDQGSISADGNPVNLGNGSILDYTLYAENTGEYHLIGTGVQEFSVFDKDTEEEITDYSADIPNQTDTLFCSVNLEGGKEYFVRVRHSKDGTGSFYCYLLPRFCVVIPENSFPTESDITDLNLRKRIYYNDGSSFFDTDLLDEWNYYEDERCYFRMNLLNQLTVISNGNTSSVAFSDPYYGHAWDEGTVTIQPTCGNTGKREYHCICGGKTKIEEIPKLTEHTWDEGEATTQATCKEAGVKTYTCSVCGQTKIVEIPKTDHLHTERRDAREATATEPGYTGDLWCTDCETLLEYGEVIEATGTAGNSGDIVDSGTCGENITWNLDSEGVLTITGSGPMTDYSSDSPSPFYVRLDVLKVVIEEGISTIGDYVFSGCDCLTDVTIPNSITRIGSNSFYECSELKEIIIPSSVTYIGKNAFSGCKSIRTVTIPDTIEEIGSSAFSQCGLRSVILPNNLSKIPEELFYQCYYLADFEIPNSVVRIEDRAFCMCRGPKQLVIPNNVEYIGVAAFFACEKIVKTVIPNNVREIGVAVFSGCENLKVVELPTNITKIPDRSFESCKSLESINVPDSVSEIGASAFYWCSTLTTFDFPANLKSIGASAFSGCRLTKIVIPDGVTRIENMTFEGCRLLEDITLPQNLKSIGEWAFRSCEMLKTIEFPNTLTKIESEAFSYCKSLTDVVLPASLMEICGAFEYCTGLENVTFLGLYTVIWYDTFAYSNAPIIYGYINSTAKKYADNARLTFVALHCDHSWNDGIILVDSTCQEVGTIKKTCTICGEEGEEEIPLKEHSWNTGEITTDPTMESEGEKTYICSVCGEIKHETIPKLTLVEYAELMITAIPEIITLEDETRVNRAREAYDNLAPEQKSQISEELLQKLIDAENSLILAKENKAKEDQKAAERVSECINNLPDISAVLYVDYRNHVREAREEYNALTNDQKKLVPLEALEKLQAYERILDASENEIKAVINRINSLPNQISLSNQSSVQAARRAYNSLTAEQKKEIPATTLKKLIRAENDISIAIRSIEKITISKKPTIQKPAPAKGKITVKWKHFKQNKKTKALWKKIKNVQVQCATDKGFKNIVKTAMVGKKKKKAVIRGLSKKTTYYVRVRYYDGVGYSAWSKVKKVKTK